MLFKIEFSEERFQFEADCNNVTIEQSQINNAIQTKGEKAISLLFPLPLISKPSLTPESNTVKQAYTGFPVKSSVGSLCL